MTWIGIVIIALPLLDYVDRWRRGANYRKAIKYCKERRSLGKPDGLVEGLVEHSRQFYEPTGMHYTALLIGLMFLL
jgi:hypothetical protein